MNHTIEALMAIGLKELEAEVYLAILKDPGATGYRVAKQLTKPKANIYKEMEKLKEKGLIIADETKSVAQFYPVPIREFLARQKKDLIESHQKAEDALKDYKVDSPGFGLYNLDKTELIFQKAFDLINNSQKKLLIASCALRYLPIYDAIQKAVERGVSVMILTVYQPLDIPGADIIHEARSEETYDSYPYEWLEVFSDGREAMLSMLYKDWSSHYKAIWCQDPYMSLLMFNAYVTSGVMIQMFQSTYQLTEFSTLRKPLIEMFKKYYHNISMTEIKELLDFYS